jgi:predicted CXXCH cytochrome family protein
MRPRRLARLAPAVLLVAWLLAPESITGTGGVYTTTKHGDATTGVQRDPAYARGDCAQCHLMHDSATPNPFALFATNSNVLCYTSGCHDMRSANVIWDSPSTYDGSTHATRATMVWPGPDGSLDASAPRARPSGDWGKCVNCHDPHGYNVDGTGLIPSLAFSREYKLCTVCHDGSPAMKDVKSDFNKAHKHPITLTGKHRATEAGTPSAYAASPINNRHAQCADCHNPHAARPGALVPATSSYLLAGVGRVAVVNGGAGAVPAYLYMAANDASPPVAEYQVCFKCHSSWTTLPATARDTAVEFNANNESFHPVEAAGTNVTPAMAGSLNGGTGLPRLTTSSTIWCSDCHASEGMPTSVTTLTGYSGTGPTGPHGSGAAAADPANLSTKILRAAYRVTPEPMNVPFNTSDFTLCFICHAAAPFSDDSGNPRADSNFRFHGFHTAKISGNPAGGVAGSLDTPGNGTTGQGNAVCKECHYTLHGTRLTYHTSNRPYTRLVSFAPSISGPSGTGAPAWSSLGRTCALKCHGMVHNPMSY